MGISTRRETYANRINQIVERRISLGEGKHESKADFSRLNEMS